VYTGAIGYISPEDEAVFSVAIRTITLGVDGGRMGSGGGIVWDSSADTEYRECLLKGNFLSGEEARPDLIETMLWDQGIALEDRHISRLRRSSEGLGYPFDEGAVRRQLDDATSRLTGPTKIRLLHHPDGTQSISVAPFDRPSVETGKIGVSDVRMDRNDPWLRHKSTRREVYDAEFDLARRRGLSEVIFLNQDGEITEGSRTNVFIRAGNRLWTPPLDSGVLPGTRRAQILHSDLNAGEKVLYPEDLLAADEILVCNGTTLLTRVQLEDTAEVSV
jgi:para-aminobenzoate synthetase/4-amino-4-deoxychorismate lyase